MIIAMHACNSIDHVQSEHFSSLAIEELSQDWMRGTYRLPTSHIALDNEAVGENVSNIDPEILN